jgi:hypothetical protein
MKELIFSSNSWHYKIAKLGGYHLVGQTDICSYTRAVIKGIFAAIIYLSLFTLVSYVLTDLVLGLIFSAISGMWIMGMIGTGALYVMGAILLVIVIMIALLSLEELYKNWRDARREKRMNKSEDSFANSAYKSWKEKYCARIRFDN